LFKIAYALTNFRKATAHRINAEFIVGVLEILDDLVSDYASSFQRIRTTVEYVGSRIDRGIARRGHEEQYQKVLERFAKLKQGHQQMGLLVEWLVRFNSEIRHAAAQANTAPAMDAWYARVDTGLDELLAMFDDYE